MTDRLTWQRLTDSTKGSADIHILELIHFRDDARRLACPRRHRPPVIGAAGPTARDAIARRRNVERGNLEKIGAVDQPCTAVIEVVVGQFEPLEQGTPHLGRSAGSDVDSNRCFEASFTQGVERGVAQRIALFLVQVHLRIAKDGKQRRTHNLGACNSRCTWGSTNSSRLTNQRSATATSVLTPAYCGSTDGVFPRTKRESLLDSTLLAASLFYRIGHFVAAPNHEMVSMLAANTGRPAFLMAHGVDSDLFSPDRRDRRDSRFTIGYVGRLSPEKNVRALSTLEQELRESGEKDFRLLIVGDGSELCRLKRCLPTAEFTGILRGEALAAAFANMDVFVFPSTTDTFGLVVLEAMSSGVPVVLAPEAARRAGVVDGLHGVHSRNFAASVRALMHNHETRIRMGVAARSHARSRAWQGVFDLLYKMYADGLSAPETRRRMPTRRFNVSGADT